MTFATRAFLRGVVAILPIALTLYLIIWLALGLEAVLGGFARWLLPEGWYIPGFGVVLGLGTVLILGVLLQNWAVRQWWGWTESLVEHVPLVRLVYRSIRQVIEYFSGDAADDAQRVVMVKIGEGDLELVGFVTREVFDDLPEGVVESGRVAVFLPMSYQMGGFTIFVSPDQLRPIDMSLEEGLEFALTAGVSIHPKPTEPGSPPWQRTPSSRNGVQKHKTRRVDHDDAPRVDAQS